jgi:RHS repeat-associated protein
VKVLQSNNNLTRFTYDDSNQTSVVSEVLNTTTFKSTYTYDSDKKLTELQDTLNYKVSCGYDGFGRLSSKTFKTSLGTALFTTSYTYTGYTDGNDNYTSAQLASMTNGSSTISYTYDANGNITAITQDSTVIAYGYDDLGQVVRENNARDNKTIIYDYDLAGNILSRTTYAYTTGSVDGLIPLSTLTYSYGNSVWKDQLTAFNGTAITYDALGNPLSYNGMTFTWEKGRQLSGLSATDLSASYTYNDAGIRTSKTVNNVTTTYQLSGDKVTAEITGNQIIYYTYDASGQVVTMNVNGAEYYFVRNGQNDVIALVDSTGAIVVEYTYSTYGEVLSTTGPLASTIGALNPYRYRGYRYDTESGLYYLQSRYYNPVWGRFINADDPSVLTVSQVDLTDKNLFSYCDNNPVMRTDFNGDYWEYALATGGTIGAGVGFSWGAIGSSILAGLGAITPGGWIVIGVAVFVTIGASVYYATKGHTNQRDSGYIGIPDTEISDRLKDPQTTKEEKRRLQKEQKARQTRNRAKRAGYNHSR